MLSGEGVYTDCIDSTRAYIFAWTTELFYKKFFLGDSHFATKNLNKVQYKNKNKFNPATFLCLSQARNWISNVICYVFFGFNCLRLELNVNLVDIGGIVDHHYLNFQYHYRMLLKCVTPVHTYLTLVLLSTWFFTLSSPSFCNLP